MKPLLSFIIILTLCISNFGWSNGGKSSSLKTPKFGTHDWIAYEGYRMAAKHKNLSWLKDEMNAFFLGTEAPDLGALASLKAGPGYKDTARCHCVLYDKNKDVVRDWAAKRVQEEFDKAREARARGNTRLAAFYAGAMAHYLGDLSQFMHLMGKGSRWGSENQNWHHRYEEVIDLTMVASNKTSTLLESSIEEENVPGDTAEEIALAIARYCDTGGGTIRTPGWMYEQWTMYIKNGAASDTSAWDKKFLEQTGRNVNIAINGVAELLAKV